MSPLRIKLGYVALCLIWGTTWMAIRVVVHDVPPIRAAGIRLLIGAVVLIVIALIKKLPWPKSRREWAFVTMLSFTMMGIPFGLIFWSEQFVTSSMTAVFYATTPLFVALLTPIVLRKTVPRGALMAMLIGLGTVAYLFNFTLRGDTRSLLGGGLILLAVLSSAVSAVFAKRELKNVDAIVSTGLQLMIGGAALCAVAAVMERGEVADWNAKSITALLFLAFVGSAVAFTLWYALVKQLPPYKLTTTNLVVPFIAITEGAFILHEMVTAAMVISAAVVAGAVAMVLRAEAEQTLSLRAPAAD